MAKLKEMLAALRDDVMMECVRRNIERPITRKIFQEEAERVLKSDGCPSDEAVELAEEWAAEEYPDD